MLGQTLTVVLLIAASVVAVPLDPRAAAIRDSPSYAPRKLACPLGLKVRQTTTTVRHLQSYCSFVRLTDFLQGPLNPAEAAYIAARTSKSRAVWKTYLFGAGLEDFDIDSFLPTKGLVAGETVPNVAISISGGGFRCVLSPTLPMALLDALASRKSVGLCLQVARF